MTGKMRDERRAARELAGQGALADYAGQATDVERRRLRAELYALLHPVVFSQLTRRIEARRGHSDCMVGIRRMRPDCLDRFHDDMDAVLDDVLRNARVPIQNLEGWVSRRLTAVTIDAHRRRRGERGALQRPRIPKWLARKLHHDRRLLGLAVEMLDWVGLEATAGVYEWPVEVWAAQRTMTVTVGDHDAANRSVAQDVATVIAAMRTRPDWYAAYVERPMARKQLPVVGTPRDSIEPFLDPSELARAAHVADDARRAELAALAVTIVAARVERGDDPRTAVVDAVTVLFGSGTGSESIDRLPGQDCTDDEKVMARLADPATIDRIVAVMLELLQ